MRYTNEQNALNPENFTIEIADNIFNRVRSLVSNSDIEEGGKFIGNIEEINGKVLIKVDSYIDSGPNVNNTRHQIIPDSSYQLKTFRLIEEKYNQDIEHIGTWHSHHCNGLQHLSSGDENGYFSTLNKSTYNVDYFFAMLVTGISYSKLQVKFYIFQKGLNEYIELPHIRIRRVSNSFNVNVYDKYLQSLEEQNIKARNSRYSNLDTPDNDYQPRWYNFIIPKRRKISVQDELKKFIIEDKKWLSVQNFFKVNLYNKPSEGVYWKWSIWSDANYFEIKFKYPQHRISEFATIECIDTKQSILIPLSANRYSRILEFIDNLKSLNAKEDVYQKPKTIYNTQSNPVVPNENNKTSIDLDKLGIKEIVVADKKWFKRYFPSSELVLKGNAIYWKIKTPFFLIFYKYPNGKVFNPANNKVIIEFYKLSDIKNSFKVEKLYMSETRHLEFKSLIEEADNNYKSDLLKLDNKDDQDIYSE